jgi:hypothetical protein
MGVTFEDAVNDMRQSIKMTASYVDQVKKTHDKMAVGEKENRGEVMANLTLCYRHLEDASMRLGKVLQHRNGGVSIYDKNVVGSPNETIDLPTNHASMDELQNTDQHMAGTPATEAENPSVEAPVETPEQPQEAAPEAPAGQETPVSEPAAETPAGEVAAPASEEVANQV